jgi:hypothetical protein
MEESGLDWESIREIPIPEYDWKNGSPEEFYQGGVKPNFVSQKFFK